MLQLTHGGGMMGDCLASHATMKAVNGSAYTSWSLQSFFSLSTPSLEYSSLELKVFNHTKYVQWNVHFWKNRVSLWWYLNKQFLGEISWPRVFMLKKLFCDFLCKTALEVNIWKVHIGNGKAEVDRTALVHMSIYSEETSSVVWFTSRANKFIKVV